MMVILEQFKKTEKVKNADDIEEAKKTTILFEAESYEVNPEVSGLIKEYKKNRKFRFIKMKVINSLKKEHTKDQANQIK